jgi:predicted transcriptional regulator
MRVEEVMTTPVVVTGRNIKVTHLRESFSRKEVSAMPVLEEDETISGIVTQKDVAICKNDDSILEDIMTDRIHIVLPNNRLKDAANTMVSNRVHHLVVMEDGKVVGMLSSMDILRQYALL